MENLRNALKKKGYITDNQKILKAVKVFEAAGLRGDRNIPCMVLDGEPGAGKTALAEAFAAAKKAEVVFIQCYQGIGSDEFIATPNIAAVISNDAENAVTDGVLVKAIKNTHLCENTVLIIDELDKGDASIDALMLDFLNSGRIANPEGGMLHKGGGNLWVFVTKNGERELSDPLLNRGRQLYVDRPSKEVFLEILGLPESHYLGGVYEACSGFSIRQAKNYLLDLEVLGLNFDEDILSQYVQVEELVLSEEEVQEMYGYIPEEVYMPEINIVKIKDNDVEKVSNITEVKFNEKTGAFEAHFNKLSELIALNQVEVAEYDMYKVIVDCEIVDNEKIMAADNGSQFNVGLIKLAKDKYVRFFENKKSLTTVVEIVGYMSKSLVSDGDTNRAKVNRRVERPRRGERR